jgi:hypothetical protein
MSDDPAEMLRSLFAIPTIQIDNDLADAEGQRHNLVDIARDSRGQRLCRKDPAADAIFHHRQMVLAKVFYSMGGVPEEQRLFFAKMAATDIAEEALAVAYNFGRLAELNRLIGEIESREGLEGDESWPLGAGPEDYQALARECGTLFDQVRVAVFTTVLRRYYLDEVLGMYENDPERFADVVEAGRQQIFEGRSHAVQ